MNKIISTLKNVSETSYFICDVICKVKQLHGADVQTKA